MSNPHSHITIGKQVEALRAELEAEREKVRGIEEIQRQRDKYERRVAEVEVQLAGDQATIEQMREAISGVAQVLASEHESVGVMVRKCFEIIEPAYRLPTNLDALHEARAQECEQVAFLYSPDDSAIDFLDKIATRAAAHSAKKGK